MDNAAPDDWRPISPSKNEQEPLTKDEKNLSLLSLMDARRGEPSRAAKDNNSSAGEASGLSQGLTRALACWQRQQTFLEELLERTLTQELRGREDTLSPRCEALWVEQTEEHAHRLSLALAEMRLTVTGAKGERSLSMALEQALSLPSLHPDALDRAFFAATELVALRESWSTRSLWSLAMASGL